MLDDALQRVRETIEKVLRCETFPARIEPAYLRGAVLAYPRRPGKSLRPALVSWACELVGGDLARTPNAATAVELYHNWTLIHDDIIDDDDTRRGGAACHRLLECATPGGPAVANVDLFGRNQAILAGDVLHAWSVDLLARCTENGVRAELAVTLLRRLCGDLTPRLIAGEARDVQYEWQREAAPEEVLEMLRMKTSLLLRFAAETGAMIGLDTTDDSHSSVQALGTFAETTGLAFQLRDDVLGLFGEAGELGKPIGADLRAGKPTLLHAEALARAKPAEKQLLQQAFGDATLDASALDRVRDMVRGAGALDAIETRARETVQAALNSLDQFPDSPAKARLTAWASFAVERTR